MANFLHNIVNIEQAPKPLKDQIRMNVNIDKEYTIITVKLYLFSTSAQNLKKILFLKT
jgi:hypothetical protein